MVVAPQTKALALFHESGLVRPRDLARAGVPRWALYALLKSGKVTQVARGVYSLADYEPGENHSYSEAMKRIPKGILCLLSALRFHDLTVQNTTEVWVAIPRTAWRPRSGGVALRVVRFSGKGLTEGVEAHHVGGVTLHVTSIARTIADCFKYRTKIGTEVAVEALQEAWRKRQLNMDEFWQFAKLNRITRVAMPYLETLPT